MSQTGPNASVLGSVLGRLGPLIAVLLLGTSVALLAVQPNTQLWSGSDPQCPRGPLRVRGAAALGCHAGLSRGPQTWA